MKTNRFVFALSLEPSYLVHKCMHCSWYNKMGRDTLACLLIQSTDTLSNKTYHYQNRFSFYLKEVSTMHSFSLESFESVTTTKLQPFVTSNCPAVSKEWSCFPMIASFAERCCWRQRNPRPKRRKPKRSTNIFRKGQGK